MTALKTALLAVSFAIITGEVLAQSVQVRTGEHGAFTRIVLSFVDRPEWRAGRTDDGYALRFQTPAPLDADLRRAFDLITRDRVAGLSSDPDLNLFSIDLACACWADISDFDTNAVIIDIRPGSPPPTARHEARLQWPAQSAPIVVAAAPHHPDEASAEDESPRRPADLTQVAQTNPPSLPRTSSDTPFTREGGPAGAASGTESATAAVDTLAVELARAVAQGLLQTDPDPDPPPDRIGSVEPGQNLSVETAIDAALGLGAATRGPLDASGTCIPIGRINVVQWAPPGGIASLGALRRDAIAEDGSLTGPGVLALARAYIHLGFGAEARALTPFISEGLDRAIILALADIADHGRSEADILTDQFACAPEAAVWRALARPFSADDLPQDVRPILAIFSTLPETLRAHLGPVMAERLRQAGLPAESRIALNAVARGGNVSIEQTLTVARLDLTGTRADIARDRLEGLAAGTGLTAADALLELFLDAERRGVAPKAAWVDDAPSLVRATRGTAVARDLAQARFRGAITLDLFDEVRRALADGPAELEQDDRAALIIALADAVVARGPDDVFLKTDALVRSRMPISDYPRDLRMRVLARYVALGLPQRALDYVPDALTTDEERILVASALASSDDFDRALASLDGVHTEEGLKQEARILSLAGRPAEAVAGFLAANDPASGTRDAIRAADWDTVARLTQPDPGGTDDAPQTDEDALPPAGNAALLSQIAQRRLSLRDLLTLTEMN